MNDRPPLLQVGEKRRCRCQVTQDPTDHCHQQADAEDMRCEFCRSACPPPWTQVNIEQAGIECKQWPCVPEGRTRLNEEALYRREQEAERRATWNTPSSVQEDFTAFKRFAERQTSMQKHPSFPKPAAYTPPPRYIRRRDT